MSDDRLLQPRQRRAVRHEALALRLRAQAGWRYRGFGFVTTFNYTDSYEDVTPGLRVEYNTTFDVLLEKPGRYPGQIVGRSPYLQPVQVMAPATMIGDIAAVTITEVSANSLFGRLVEARMGCEPMLAEG